MGDKIHSKNHVVAHQVPVVPGIAEPGLSDEQLLAAAGQVGYPLLIKAQQAVAVRGCSPWKHQSSFPKPWLVLGVPRVVPLVMTPCSSERLGQPTAYRGAVLADQFGHTRTG